MRVNNVDIGRVGVCMLLCCSQIHYSHMVAQKQARGLRGLGCANIGVFFLQKNLEEKISEVD